MKPSLRLCYRSFMLWFLLASAFAQDTWLTAEGAGPYAWGTTNLPTDAIPRRKDYYLPDSGFLSTPAPNDLELPAPKGERRILRYVAGVLVDAWQVSTTPLDPGPLVAWQKPAWSGPVMGPADNGYRAYGTGSSWDLPDRTIFYWHDRLAQVDILASRAIPPPQYGIQRAIPLPIPSDTGSKANITGNFMQLIRDSKGRIASCFDQSRMPVKADVNLILDSTGMPARLKVDADQPSFNLDECLAGSLLSVRGAPRFEGLLQITRFR